MRLTCPQCETQYEVPDDAIQGEGRHVKCSNCGHTWFHSLVEKNKTTGSNPAIQPSRIDLSRFNLMPHVKRALSFAAYFAQERATSDMDWEITAGDILRAVLVMHQDAAASKSEAFKTLQNILPIVQGEDPSPNLVDVSDQIFVSQSLAEGLEAVLQRWSDGAQDDAQISIWGRDLVAVALLARDDPSLGAMVNLAGKTIVAVRQIWLDFLSDDSRPEKSPLSQVLRGFLEVLQQSEGFGLEVDAGWHPLVAGIAPDWADGWGEDQDGPWVSFKVGSVETVLRWIPPGRFRMGSPEDEPGRYPDESPQIDITHSEGFWLMDAPVTQALWEGGDGAEGRQRIPEPVCRIRSGRLSG